MTEDRFAELRTEIRSGLNMNTSLSDEELLVFIERRMLQEIELVHSTASEKRKLIRRMFDSFRGLRIA